jgi:hypothetical protein
VYTEIRQRSSSQGWGIHLLDPKNIFVLWNVWHFQMPGFVEDNIPCTQRVGSSDMTWTIYGFQPCDSNLSANKLPSICNPLPHLNVSVVATRQIEIAYQHMRIFCECACEPNTIFFDTARRICMFACCQVIEPTHLRYFVANHVIIFILAILVLTQFLSWCWERNMRQRWGLTTLPYFTYSSFDTKDTCTPTIRSKSRFPIRLGSSSTSICQNQPWNMSFQVCRCQQWKKNHSVALSIQYR